MIKKILAGVLLTLGLANYSYAQVVLPYVFSSGLINSAQMNADLGALRDEINNYEQTTNLTQILQIGNSAGGFNIDMNLNQLKNVRIDNLTANPTPANIGRLFFNTTTSQLGYDTGSSIVSLIGPQGLSSVLGVSNSAGATDINFNGRSALSLRLENLAADPGTPSTGSFYFNTVTSRPRVWTGASWLEINNGAGGGPFSDASTAIQNSVDSTKQMKWDLTTATTGTTTTQKYSQTANRTVTFPDATDTLVGKATTDTLTNKSLSDVSNFVTNSIDPTKKLNLDLSGATTGTTATLKSNQTAGRTITLPDATDTLVGKATTDTLTNKTIAFASNTFSGALPIANGGTNSTTAVAAFDALSPTTTNGDLIARSGGTNARLPVGSSGQVLKVVGGAPAWATFSGGINYISANPDAESDTSGWATYDDGASATPVDGTGGSPVETWTRTTTTPLRGSGSFLLTKDAANRQGQGASFAFTVDSSDQAKVLSIGFDYAVASGTYLDGDLTAYIYDVTNAVIIQPASFKLLSASTGLSQRFISTFQTASNSTSYRLILHTATASSSAYTVKFDNFGVGPQAQFYGAPVTDWVAYTPTITGFGTPTSVSFFSKRTGDSLEVVGTLTPGTSTAVQSQITLGYNGANANVTIDSTKTPNTLVGSASAFAAGATLFTWGVEVTGANNWVTVGVQTSTGSMQNSTNGSAVATTGQTVQVYFKVPIQGWSSSVQMSNDADARIVKARYSTGAGQSIASGTTTIVNFDTKGFDTHSAVTTGASWKYTAQQPGKYDVAAKVTFTSAAWTATNNTNVYIYKNGVLYSQFYYNIFVTGTYALPLSIADSVDLVAGDYVDVRVSQDSGGARSLQNAGEFNTISITRTSGLSSIAASETISAIYNTAAGQAIANTTATIINFDTKVKDTHGSVTTGASWKFTAPTSGVFHVDARASFGAGVTTAGEMLISIFKNGVEYKQGSRMALNSATNNTGVVSADVDMIAGDFVDVRLYHSNGVSRSLETLAASVYCDIRKVGN